MNGVNGASLKGSKKWLRFLPFLLLGSSVFAANSATEFHYLFRGYLTLLELQIGIVVLYFFLAKFGKAKNRF